MNQEEMLKQMGISEDLLKKKEEFFQKIYPFKSYNGEDKVIPISEVVEEIKNTPKTNRGFKTGFEHFDNIIGEFRPGQLVVLSARTGEGKTQLCQDWTYAFTKQGKNPLWFSFEMGYEEFIERFEDNVPAFFVPKKMGEVKKLKWLREKVYESIIKYNTKVIFIDQLHFLVEMGSLADMGNLSLYIGSLMREIKLLALETETTIFLITHLKKTELDKPPEIGDLRDSSFIAQESDIVLFLFKEQKKDKSSSTGYVETGFSILKVDKNRRTGKLGFTKLEFQNRHFIQSAFNSPIPPEIKKEKVEPKNHDISFI